MSVDPFAVEQKEAESFLSGGAVAAKWPTVGYVVEGTILSYEMRQQTDYDSGELLFWDGKKREIESKVSEATKADQSKRVMQLLVTVQGEPTYETWEGLQYTRVAIPDDDGQRTLYVKSGLQNAVAKALRDAKAKPEANAFIRVERTADGQKSNPKYAAPHKYTVTWTPAAQNGRVAADFLSQEAVDEGNPFGVDEKAVPVF